VRKRGPSGYGLAVEAGRATVTANRGDQHARIEYDRNDTILLYRRQYHLISITVSDVNLKKNFAYNTRDFIPLAFSSPCLSV